VCAEYGGPHREGEEPWTLMNASTAHIPAIAFW
jgi:hypothetical protein